MPKIAPLLDGTELGWESFEAHIPPGLPEYEAAGRTIELLDSYATDSPYMLMAVVERLKRVQGMRQERYYRIAARRNHVCLSTA